MPENVVGSCVPNGEKKDIDSLKSGKGSGPEDGKGEV